MKPLASLFALIALLCPVPSYSSETASATVFCYSLRFGRGIDPDGNYSLDIMSQPGAQNGELALDFFNSGYTHSAYLSLTDDLLGDTLSGQLGLDVPTGGDLNGDGFFDFLQVSQGVNNLVTSGQYNLDVYGSGSTTATWNRQAGSKDGLCLLTIKLMPFQPVSFNLPFEILEYKGPLVYTPGQSNVTGTANLVQTGNSGALLSGNVQFTKNPADRFNNSTLSSGVWTNELQTPMSYKQHGFKRDTSWPTNYYGYLEFFDDTNPTGFYPYALWVLSIDDLNDTNHNGIPDFSDDPGSGSRPRRPQLDLTQSATNLLVTVHGDVGFIYDVQSLTDLGTNGWKTAVSITLTNDPQVVQLPPPDKMAGFWRLLAR